MYVYIYVYVYIYMNICRCTEKMLKSNMPLVLYLNRYWCIFTHVYNCIDRF